MLARNFQRTVLRTISQAPRQLTHQVAFSSSQNHLSQKPKMVMYEPLPSLRDGELLKDYIKRAQYQKLDKNGQKRKLLDPSNPERLRADDVVTVVYKNQKPVTGQVIMVKRQGVASTLLIRNKITGLGVEIHIPMFHPNILRVDIVRRPAKYRPRNRHYYIRNSRLDVGELDGKKLKK